MMQKRFVFSFTLGFTLLAAAGWAGAFGPYPGFDEMIRRAAAIAVVRISPDPSLDSKAYDPSQDPPNSPHRVRVLRTIKGDIPENAEVLLDIEFFPFHGPQKVGASRSTTDTVALDALQALDQFILDDARSNEHAGYPSPRNAGADYLLFLSPNSLNPREPGRWLNLNFPGSAIPLNPGAFESAHREEMRVRAKEEQANPAQARSDAARTKSAQREIVRLILTKLGVFQLGLRRRIEPLLTR